MTFGPQDKDEEAVFAVEGLRADLQYEMLRQMKRLGLSQAGLAKKLEVSAAWVSQILSDDANLTLESIAKIFSALECQCQFSARPRGAEVQLPSWSVPDIVNADRLHPMFEIGRQQAADFTSSPIYRKQTRIAFGAASRSTSVISRCYEAA